MREYAKKPESQSRILDSNPKASKQVSIDVILQRYKERNIQRFAEDEELIQGKFDRVQRAEIDEYEVLQDKFEPVSSSEHESIQREEKPNNTGLPNNLKSGIENLSGYSMDDVKVHYNSDKPAQLQALAYAQGTEIHVAPGQEKHLHHEAWHVVQQKQGRVQPTTQLQGVNVNDNEGLEKKAYVMGNNINNKPSVSLKRMSHKFNVIQKVDEEYFGDSHTRLNKGDLKLATITIPPNIKSELEYSRNKMIGSSKVFNLAGKSGVLIKKIESQYHVASGESKFPQQTFAQPEVVNQVVTIGISTCSFIVMTDDQRTFAMVAHLDSTDNIDTLVGEMVSQGLTPTCLFASIINGINEKTRIQQYRQRFDIQNVRILDRGEGGRTDNHHFIGYDLQKNYVFGKMGMPKDELKKYLKDWLTDFINPKGRNLTVPLTEFGLSNKIEDVRTFLGNKNTGIFSIFGDPIKKGAKKCLSEENALNELFDLLFHEDMFEKRERKVNCVMLFSPFQLIGRGSASAKGVHQHSRRA